MLNLISLTKKTITKKWTLVNIPSFMSLQILPLTMMYYFLHSDVDNKHCDIVKFHSPGKTILWIGVDSSLLILEISVISSSNQAFFAPVWGGKLA